MSAVFNQPLVFRNTKYRSLNDICSYFRPNDYNHSDYLDLISSRFSHNHPKSDAEFIENIKPNGYWLFFCGKFYKTPLDFILEYGLPSSMIPSVQALVNDNPVETENSLIMLIQAYKKKSIEESLSGKEKTEAFFVFGRKFDSYSSLSTYIPYAEFASFSGCCSDIEGLVESKMNDYLQNKSLRLGIVLLKSVSEIAEYTALSKFDIVLKLRSIYFGKNSLTVFWPHLNESDSPIVVNGQLFNNIKDAFKVFAIEWVEGMSELQRHEFVTAKVLQELFRQSNLLHSSKTDLISINGETTNLFDLVTSIGGKANIYLTSLRERFFNYEQLSLQEMVDSDLLGKNDAVLVNHV